MLWVLFVFVSVCFGGFLAGVAKVNCAMPIGVPLAGYNHGARRVPEFPVPKPTRYTTWMTPSVGLQSDGVWCRALTIIDTTSNSRVTFSTIDAIGGDGAVLRSAVRFAQAQGFKGDVTNVILTGAHSHSGPGAIAAGFLWQVAPAIDLLVPEVQELLITKMASAYVQSEKNLRPALIDANTFQLLNVTRNRRCGRSPYVKCDSIDPNLGLLRVDDAATKTTIAVLWNYAFHGTCFGPSNLKQSGDLMGFTNQAIELAQSGIVSLFMQADAGDVDPQYAKMCDGQPQDWKGPGILRDFILGSMRTMQPTAAGALSVAAQSVYFGPTLLNFTLASPRFNNCSSGGPLDVCTICRVLDCHLNGNLQSNWVENNPQFGAVRIDVNSRSVGVVTIPGEAIVELGNQIRSDMSALGFTTTFLSGYSNAHMGYFTTAREYDIGGYEAQLTLWGIDTADHVRTSCRKVATKIAPNQQ